MGKKTGPNPTDRAKDGTKRSLLTHAAGIPLGLAVDGANRNDHKLFGETINSVPVKRPRPTASRPQGMCLDGRNQNGNATAKDLFPPLPACWSTLLPCSPEWPTRRLLAYIQFLQMICERLTPGRAVLSMLFPGGTRKTDGRQDQAPGRHDRQGNAARGLTGGVSGRLMCLPHYSWGVSRWEGV